MGGTRLTPGINLEGMAPEDAFAVLGDETRLDIVRILWTAGAFHQYDDIYEDHTTMSFSELRRRAGITDNGRFNYHLSKLTPQFVRQTDDGYRLSSAGKKLARTVVAISGEPTSSVSAEVDTDCPVCGGSVTATYEDQWLRFACTECDGVFGDSAPEGTLLNSPVTPTAMSDRTADEVLTTSLYRCMLDLTYLMQGLCRECAGVVEKSISVCDDHDTDGPCSTCGTPFETWGEMRCTGCRFSKRLPVELCLMGLPQMIAFLYGQDINVLAPSLDEIVDVLRTRVETSVTEEPFRVTGRIEAGSEVLVLTVDEQLNVVDSSR